MAEETAQPKEPDYLGRPVGTFGLLGGNPADYARNEVLNRAGVPFTADPEKEGDERPAHPLRADLEDVHASADVPASDRLPDPFPPESYDGPLDTARDYLALIDATVKQQRAEAKAKTDAEKAKAEKTKSETEKPKETAAAVS